MIKPVIVLCIVLLQSCLSKTESNCITNEISIEIHKDSSRLTNDWLILQTLKNKTSKSIYFLLPNIEIKNDNRKFHPLELAPVLENDDRKRERFFVNEPANSNKLKRDLWEKVKKLYPDDVFETGVINYITFLKPNEEYQISYIISEIASNNTKNGQFIFYTTPLDENIPEMKRMFAYHKERLPEVFNEYYFHTTSIGVDSLKFLIK